MILKTALVRKINRMIFKCRLSLTSPTKAANRHGGIVAGGGNGGGSGGYGYARRTSTAARADNAYLLAVFFVLFLLVMLVTQVMVMRSEWSATAGKSSAWRSQASQRPPAVRPYRFGRQPAPFGRVLAADKSRANAGGDAHAARPDLTHDPPTRLGQWLERLPQEQSRDAWVDELWLCFQPAPRHRCPWQPVAGPDKCFVYSAYHDDSRETSASAYVRVIGVARTKKQDRLWCQLGFASAANNTIRWHQVQAQIKTIREHWNLRYSAAFILCPLKDVPHGAKPDLVSVSSEQHPALPDYAWPRPTATRDEFNASFGHWSDSPTGNILPVIGHEKSAGAVRHQLAVCVKPLHYNFDRVGQLVEFIEMHRLLGATRFTFYNHTVGEHVDCLLRRYADEGLVEVLPWRQLDVASQKEIRTEGIFASLNDCLYRHMFDSQYLLMIDLDELIVPRRQRSLIEMINSTLNMTSSSRIGAYYFRNAFFYLSWPDDPEAASWSNGSDEASDLISLKKTRRNVKLHPHR